MTFYEKELHRIRSIVYSNEGQINTVIGIRNYIENNYAVDLNLDLISHIQFAFQVSYVTLVQKILWTNSKTILN